MKWCAFFLPIFLFGDTVQHLGSQFPDQDRTCCPTPQYKHGVLTPRQPQKSLEYFKRYSGISNGFHGYNEFKQSILACILSKKKKKKNRHTEIPAPSPHYCSSFTFSREKQKYLVWDNERVRGKRLSSNDIISKSPSRGKGGNK